MLTEGGGAPGPVNELNVEIYYPAYLYLTDGSGNPAPRPTIVSAPSKLRLGQTFSVTVGSNDQIGAVNLIRVGFSTHSFNPEQRLIPVPFSQSGQTVTGKVKSAPEKIPPGCYMLFFAFRSEWSGPARSRRRRASGWRCSHDIAGDCSQ